MDAVDRRVSRRRQELRANIPKILGINGAWMFLVLMPVVVPFFSSHGLSMQEIFQLQAIFAISIVILEVPSGYVSDLLGRKRCLIAASAFHGIAFSVLAVGDDFGDFVVFELLAALATSLFSGTDVALIYDSVEALEERGNTSRYLGKRLLFSQVGETLAALLCAVLVLVHLNLPAYVNAVVAWVPLLIACTITEPPRRRLDARNHGQNLRQLTDILVRQSQLLRLILINLIVYGLATLLAVWAFQGFWARLGIPLGWFGLLWAAYNLTVALVANAAHRIEARWGSRAVLGAIAVCPVLGYGGMALSLGVRGDGLLWVCVAVACGLCFQAGRGLTQVVIKDALNTRVPTELRATANSVASLGVRLGFAGLAPALGYAIDSVDYVAALALAAALFAVLGALVCVPLMLQVSARPAPSSE